MTLATAAASDVPKIVKWSDDHDANYTAFLREVREQGISSMQMACFVLKIVAEHMLFAQLDGANSEDDRVALELLDLVSKFFHIDN